MAYVEREAIARRVVGAITDPDVPSAQAARLALDLIDQVEPPVQATLSTPLDLDPEGVASLSVSQLLSVAQGMGLDPSPALPMGELEASSES
jgi:hypothetical protein